MKKIMLVILILLSSLLYSTTQISEKVIYNDMKYSLDVHKNSSPLGYLYHYYNYKSPFRWTSTANYRGYIGTWIIKDSKLYLSKLTYRNSIEIPLEHIFHNYVKKDMVEAFWYTDQIIIETSKSVNNYYLDIVDGKIVKSKKITDTELSRYLNYKVKKFIKSLYDKIYENNNNIINSEVYQDYLESQQNLEMAEKNKKLNPRRVNKLLDNIFIDDSNTKYKKNIIIFTDEEIKKTAQYMDNFYSEIDREAEERKRLEKIFEDRVAKKTYSKIAGYEAFSSKFQIKESKIYNIKKSLPEGAPETKKLFMNMSVNSNYRIKWYLSVYDDKTNYNWYDLEIIFKEIESRISSITWLNKLIHDDSNTTIAIRINEKVLSGSNDEEISQLWDKSGLSGEPQFSIELENKKYRSELIIGKDSKSSIIYYCHNKYKYTPLKEYNSFQDIIKAKYTSWYKNFDFDNNSTNNRYLIVSDNGDFRISKDWVIEDENDLLSLID